VIEDFSAEHVVGEPGGSMPRGATRGNPISEHSEGRRWRLNLRRDRVGIANCARTDCLMFEEEV
jgi:hypothetical protein